MEIDKAQIVELLKKQGDTDKADQARSELPDKVDTDKDSGLLDRYGINAQDLLGQLPGGLGGDGRLTAATNKATPPPRSGGGVVLA